MTFQSIDGSKGKGGNFVCPWCGASFERRWIASDGVMSLEEHWKTSPRCSQNRHVSNQTQSKDLPADSEVIMPGEHVLRLVREKEDR